MKFAEVGFQVRTTSAKANKNRIAIPPRVMGFMG
jgi:hypothetical protein